MNCSNCGTRIPEGDKHCSTCGRPVKPEGMLTNGANDRSASREDRRSGTVLPVLASAFSLVSGAVLAVYAYSQLQLPDAVSKIFGVWNMAVVMAYVWLAYALVKRQERAYNAGLLLSLGNVLFIGGQYAFWTIVGIAEGMSEDERLAVIGIAPFVFILTDLLLAGAVFLSFRDLVHPMLPENVAEPDLLLKRLAQTEEDASRVDPVAVFLNQSSGTALTSTTSVPAPPTQAEKDQFLAIRRNFIAETKSSSRGGAEINVSEDGVLYDLVVKSVSSYLRSEADSKKEQRRYVFHPYITRSSQLIEFEKVRCYIVTISASQDILSSVAAGVRGGVSLYVIREWVWVGKRGGRSKQFEEFANRNYGLVFHTYKRKG